MMEIQQQAPTVCNRTDGGKRIPLSLQAVFLNGNRGKEVHTPPPDASAMKVFNRANIRGRRWRPFRSWSSSEVSSRNSVATVATVAAASVETEVTKKPVPARKVKRTKSTPEPSLAPQDYLDGMMHSRGYSATKYSTLLTAYYNKPTPLQLASYGVYVADMIRSGNIEAVQEVLNLGLSPNACNIHGESIVHSVCRRSDIHMLDVLLQAGCEIQVSDDNGRTPLHDACWAPEPNFPLIEKLLERDKQMLYMMDSRGHLPLSYTRKHHWSEWLQFLQSKKDDYWPRGAALPCNNETGLLFSEPNSRPIRDPSLTLTLSLTQMVAGGKLKPKEARFMQNEFENKQNVLSSCNDDDDDSDCSDDSDDDDNDSVVSTASSESSTTKEELHDSWNFEEMNDILNSLTKPNRAPLAW